MRRAMMWATGVKTWNLPALNGTVDVWVDASDKSSLTILSGDKVSRLANKMGDSSKDFVQATTAAQGTYTLNHINGLPAVTGFTSYSSGDNSSFKYMHDRSTAYAVFDVYSMNGMGGSPTINSTTNGGNTNGVLLFPFGTQGLRKTIRQAPADGTTSADLIVAITGNSIWSLNNFFFIADVFYGYQVTGTDYTLSINNNAPAASQTDAYSSSYPSINHNYPLKVGEAGSFSSIAEKIIIKWPTQTRAQMDADITAIKNYIQTKYALW